MLAEPPDNLATLQDELERTEKLKEEDVIEMRRRIKMKPTYPQNIPDVVLAWFLNCSNFDIDTAMKCLDSSIKMRSVAPELFMDRDPFSSSIKQVWELTDYFMADKPTAEGYRIYYAGVHDPDPTYYSFCDASKLYLMVPEADLVQNGLYPGMIVILDAKGASLRHMLKVKLKTVKNFLKYVQEGIPINIIQVHIINVSSIVDKMMFIAKPFIKKELMDNVKFHSGDLKDLFKSVPRDLLPVEVGGTASSSRASFRNASRAKLEKLADWFEFEKTLRLNYQEKPGENDLEESLKDLCID